MRHTVIFVNRGFKTYNILFSLSLIEHRSGDFASFFIDFYDVFGSAVINLEILSCLLYREALFIDRFNKLLPFVGIDRDIAAFCAKDL